MDLRYGRLTSELISLSVGSELTSYVVLDSFSARGHGKNCPVKIFEVYVEIHCIGGFVFWLNLPATGGVEELKDMLVKSLTNASRLK